MERTLVLLKPDAFERNLVGEIMSIIDAKELNLIGSKLFTMTQPMVEKHYKNHLGKSFFPQLVEFMTSGPSLAAVYEGNSACAAVRQLIGEKHPSQSPPGSIRGKYATEYPRNLIHGSDHMDDAEYEIGLYFDETELFGSKYKQNITKMQKLAAEKLAKVKTAALEIPLTEGKFILFPEQVKKGMTLLDKLSGQTYRVMATKKMPGGKHRISLCNSNYVDQKQMVDMYTSQLDFTDTTWTQDQWKLLKLK